MKHCQPPRHAYMVSNPVARLQNVVLYNVYSVTLDKALCATKTNTLPCKYFSKTYRGWLHMTSQHASPSCGCPFCSNKCKQNSAETCWLIHRVFTCFFYNYQDKPTARKPSPSKNLDHLYINYFTSQPGIIYLDVTISIRDLRQKKLVQFFLRFLSR